MPRIVVLDSHANFVRELGATSQKAWSVGRGFHLQVVSSVRAHEPKEIRGDASSLQRRATLSADAPITGASCPKRLYDLIGGDSPL